MFVEMASAFDACKGIKPGAAKCDHEHAGLLDTMRHQNTQFMRKMTQIYGEIDFAEIARELSKSQAYDNLAVLTG